MQRYLEPSNHLNYCDQKEQKNANLSQRREIFHDHLSFIKGLFDYKYQSVYVKFVLCKKGNKLDG